MPRHKPVDGKSYMIKIEHDTMERLLHIVRWLAPGAGDEINSDDVARGNECDHRGRLIRFILAEASASILETIEDLDQDERTPAVFGSRLSLATGPSFTSTKAAEDQLSTEAIDALLERITAETEGEPR